MTVFFFRMFRSIGPNPDIPHLLFPILLFKKHLEISRLNPSNTLIFMLYLLFLREYSTTVRFSAQWLNTEIKIKSAESRLILNAAVF